MKLQLLLLALTVSAATAFETAEHTFSREPASLTPEGLVVRPSVPVSRRLLNAALCLEFDARWELASDRTIRLADGRTVTIDASCVTAADQRVVATRAYESERGDRHELCLAFDAVPTGEKVVRCDIHSSEELTLQSSTWREHSPK